MNKIVAVLVVEQDDGWIGVITSALSSPGYRVEVARSTDAALEWLTRGAFDVLLADTDAPGIGGVELARRAKRLRPDIAVVVMTGHIEGFAYDEAIDSGVADFIAKPFTATGITLRLRHVLHQEKLRMLAGTDELTGLANRRGFLTMGLKQLQLARRNKTGVYLLYADLDHLKMINDACGHQEGDAALVEIANLLKGTYRESDIVARIGGDEFVVVPIGTTGDNIPQIVGRLFKNLDAVNARRKRSYNLSLSVGVAYYDPAHPCSVEELLAAGDRLMYEEKKRKAQ
jgi:diguanylate cyclase (GGDEF)-like protein